jgi:hypothetical protein
MGLWHGVEVDIILDKSNLSVRQRGLMMNNHPKWDWFKEKLASQDMTVASLAKTLGISTSSVASFGSRVPAQHFPRLAELFGISEKELGAHLRRGPITSHSEEAARKRGKKR